MSGFEKSKSRELTVYGSQSPLLATSGDRLLYCTILPFARRRSFSDKFAHLRGLWSKSENQDHSAANVHGGDISWMMI